MAYGTLKCDNIVFDNGGVDKLLTVSGLFYSTSGALTVTGTISGGNVTAPTATFTTLTGTTTAGTTATFTSGSFTSLTGVTTTGTTANFVTHNGASGIFTSLVSGATITGTTANFTSGNFISLSGTTTTVTSGVFSAGSATAPSVAVGTGTSNSPGIYSPGTDQLAISTSGSGRLYIDSSGRLLVGTSSARSNFNNNLDGATLLQVEGTTFNTTTISVTRNSNDTGSPAIEITKTRGAVNNQNTVVISGDPFGFINFSGTDGTNPVRGASINAWCDGTPGTGSMPGRLVFSTTPSGSASPTERMRIDSSGTSTFTPASATTAQIINVTNNTVAVSFRIAGTQYGYINVATTGTTYSTSSDYRLKENVVPLIGAIDRFNQLQVHRFNFITDPDKTVDGFLAHEAQSVVPECVTGEKDAVDDEGNPIYQGIDQSKLVPLLTAALQEAIAKIEALEVSNAYMLARLTALEAV